MRISTALAAFSLPVLGVLALLVYNAGLKAGAEEAVQLERLQTDWNGSKAQTADAVERWKSKTGSRAMEGRHPYLLSFPDHNCIKLELEPLSVGGEPIYCYRANSLQLLEEHSDVE